MESSFDANWGHNTALNDFWYQYEKINLHNYAQSEAQERKHTMFTLPEQADLKYELDNTGKSLENPYRIMKRWVKWEMMEMEALMESIHTRNQ